MRRKSMSCPDVCPTTLIEVSAVLEELGDGAEQVQPLSSTVDPERETPEVMAEYVANFDPRILGLTGSPEQIKRAAQAFRAYYAKVEQEGVAVRSPPGALLSVRCPPCRSQRTPS